MKKIIQNQEFELVDVPGGNYELGWRHDKLLPAKAIETLEHFTQPKDFRSFYFSPPRKVTIAPFKIATTTITWEDLVDWEVESFYEEANTVIEFSVMLNEYLAQYKCRLPTEDEFEIACGGSLFPWGDELPKGIPHQGYTSFTKHTLPSTYGLHLDPDTYTMELTFGQLKYGDGGESVCGDYPWPVPWLSFCPAYRINEALFKEAFWEFLEDAQIRVVIDGITG